MMSDWLMYILIIGMMLPEMIIGAKKLYQWYHSHGADSK